MGILNITPDSFFDGGRYDSEKNMIERAQEILEQGGDIIDIGAYSSRPGAIDISAKEELNRLMPALKSIKKEFPKSIISIDTFRSEIVKVAFDNGIDIINDIKENICLIGGTTLYRGFTERLKYELMQDNLNFNLSQTQDRQYANWIGGSIISSLNTFSHFWVNRNEYDEIGDTAEAIDSKCF